MKPALGSPLYIGHPLGVLALGSLEKCQYNKEGGAMSSRREGGRKGREVELADALEVASKKNQALCKSESSEIPRLPFGILKLFKTFCN